ncbi:hypothetical protein J6590_105386, partial [Homalodisca vitripennis]
LRGRPRVRWGDHTRANLRNDLVISQNGQLWRRVDGEAWIRVAKREPKRCEVGWRLQLTRSVFERIEQEGIDPGIEDISLAIKTKGHELELAIVYRPPDEERSTNSFINVTFTQYYEVKLSNVLRLISKVAQL